jgi:hypothetical protein
LASVASWHAVFHVRYPGIHLLYKGTNCRSSFPLGQI